MSFISTRFSLISKKKGDSRLFLWDQANAWHKAGVEAGGTAIEDPPGEREGSGMYLAYLRDPDGNKLCALHRIQQ